MIRNSIIALILLFASVLYSQQIGEWRNYTNKQNVKKIAIGSEGVWCATSGGTFFATYQQLKGNDGNSLQLTKSEGLSSQFLSAVDIDETGKVWFGMENGIINIYDPSSGKIDKILDINQTDNSQKSINEIKIIGNTVYVSTQFGLSLINATTKQFIDTITKFGGFPSSTIVNSILLINELLYVATENGVAVQKAGSQNLTNPESWNVFIKGQDIPAGNIYSSVLYNGQVIIATDVGLFKLEGNAWVKFTSINNDVFDLAVDGSTLYLIRSANFGKVTGTEFQSMLNFSSRSLTSLKALSSSEFVIGSTAGIVYLTSDAVHEFIPNGPTTNSFQELDVDNDGNLWVGTGRDAFGTGFLKFDGNQWITFNQSTTSSLLSNAFHNIYAAPDNTVYALNWGRGFTRIQNSNLENFYLENTGMTGIPDDPEFLVIEDMRYDSKGNAWILNFLAADQNVLSVLTTDNKWYHFSLGAPYSPQVLQAQYFEIDNNDTKWFAVEIGASGLYYFNENNTLDNTSDDNWGRLSISEYFGGNTVTEITVDKRGELWIGTTLGATIITNPSSPINNRFSVFPLRQQTINAIAVDPINRKWVGTRQGVFVMSSDGSSLIAQYDSKNSPLPSDNISSIAFDEQSGLAYIGTDFGLSTLVTDAILPNESFSNLFVYPNPFYISNGENQLTIDGLIEDSFIKILNITGDLVTDLTTPGGKIGFWDGRNSSGDLVPSGIYIIVVSDAEANKVESTKVAVIRR